MVEEILAGPSPEPTEPAPWPTQEASPVDDLERRLRVLNEAGVHAYKDGPIEIVFGARPAPPSAIDELGAKFAALEADARARGGVL
jgi:hypothetical protein